MRRHLRRAGRPLRVSGSPWSWCHYSSDEGARRKPQLGGRRGLERRQPDEANAAFEQAAERRLRQPFHSLWRDEVDDEAKRHLSGAGKLDDPEPAHLELAGDRAGRPRHQRIADSPEVVAVVRHEASTAIDQAKREIGLAAARGTAQEHPVTLELDAGAVELDHAPNLPGHGRRGWRPSGRLSILRGAVRLERQADDEARALDLAGRVVAVLRPDSAAMGFDDLLGDGEAQARMDAEFLATRPLRVEALEDRLELAFGKPRPLVLDDGLDPIPGATGRERDGACRRTERYRVFDQVAEHLRKAPLQPAHHQPIVRREPQVETRLPWAVARCINLDERAEELAEIRLLADGAIELGVQPRCVGDVGDETVEAMDVLEDNRHQMALPFRVLHARRRLHGAAQRRQRILDLVGHVGGEALDGVHALPKELRHPPQGTGEIADLIAAAGEIGYLGRADPSWP